MFTFLFIYILGIIVSACLIGYSVNKDIKEKNTDITLDDLMGLIVIALFSWVGVGFALYCMYEEYKDTPIIKRKR